MPAVDNYAGFSAALTSPLIGAEEVTPSDDDDLAHVSRSIWVGTGGDLTVTMAGGQTVTYAGLPAGLYPFRVSRIHATGTSADDIVAAW